MFRIFLRIGGLTALICNLAFKISPSDIYYDTFPQNFEFGVATASYQIEGGKALRGVNIWDTFTSKEGNVEGKDFLIIGRWNDIFKSFLLS